MKKGKKILNIFISIIIAIIVTMFIYSMFLVGLYKLYLFNKIGEYTFLILLLIFLVVSIAVSILFIVFTKRNSRVSNFIENHTPGISILIICINAALITMQKELVYQERAMEIVKISWTIYATGVAAFVFWHGYVYKKYMDNKDSRDGVEEEGISSYESEYLSVQKKRNNYQSVINMTEPIIYISIDTLLLVLATSTVYVISTYSRLSEIMIILSFYMSTNTLINILFKIIQQLYLERKQMLKENKYSIAELNKAKNNYFVYAARDLAKKITNLFSKLNKRLESVQVEELLSMSQVLLEKLSLENVEIFKYKKEILDLLEEFISKFELIANEKTTHYKNKLKQFRRKYDRLIRKA